jgi:hypothetical protein
VIAGKELRPDARWTVVAKPLDNIGRRWSAIDQVAKEDEARRYSRPSLVGNGAQRGGQGEEVAVQIANKPQVLVRHTFG